MIEFIYEYWSLVVIMFLAMMSPGPDFILVIKNGQYGFKSGLATSLGITLGFTIHTCFVIFGFSYIITQNPVLKDSVSFCGAVYLFFLALKIWKASKEHINEPNSKSIIKGVSLKDSLKDWIASRVLPL